MESIDLYRTEMMNHLPEKDDNKLFEYHRLTAERLLTNVDGESIREAFMDIIDCNWMKCEEICRETLERVESRILSDETENRNEDYWSQMNRIRDEYNTEIGESLRSKMEFVRLDYLDARQAKDFHKLLEDIRQQAIEEAGEEHFETELKLRMTWGRIIVFYQCWVECRKESVGALNNILDIIGGEEVMAGETNPVQMIMERIESQDGFDGFSLQFAHVSLINRDFFCYKVLLRKLREYLDLVARNESFHELEDLHYNISTFQISIFTRASMTCHGYELCENIIERDQQGLEESAQLLAWKSGPLLHLKDLLRKLYVEGNLNQSGVEVLIDDIQQEETNMTVMILDSLVSLMEVSYKVSDATEQLRKAGEEWLPKRSESIAKMREIIEKLNKTTKDVAITQTVSSSVGIVGGAIIIGGLILAPFTFGASLVPAAIAGGVVSGLGAATAIGAAVTEIVIDKGQMEKATTCVEEDKVLFEEVASRIENLNRNSNMLLRYIPQDELESLISVWSDPQSTVRLRISSKFQVDPRIAMNVAGLISIGGKSIVMPVSRMVISGTIAASKVAVLAVAHGIAAIGVALDIANLVLASVKLGKGAKSENAEKLEEVVREMEQERSIVENCFA